MKALSKTRVSPAAVGTMICLAGVALVLGGCPPPPPGCDAGCIFDALGDASAAAENCNGLPKEHREGCLSDAFFDLMEDVADCCAGTISQSFAPSVPAPAYMAWADVDWPSVNPMAGPAGSAVELIVVDMDTSLGLDGILELIPADAFDEEAWTDLRETLLLDQIQGNVTEVEFDYLPMSDVAGLTLAQLTERGPNSPWSSIGVDDDSTDGFSILLEGAAVDWYIVRIYLVDQTPSSSRFGFGHLNIVPLN